jgi:hypothetical protein
MPTAAYSQASWKARDTAACAGASRAHLAASRVNLVKSGVPASFDVLRGAVKRLAPLQGYEAV